MLTQSEFINVKKSIINDNHPLLMPNFFRLARDNFARGSKKLPDKTIRPS